MVRHLVRISTALGAAVLLVNCGDGSVEPLPAPFTAITAGLAHTCGLVGDGGAYCWGFNERGELGDGSRRQRSTPVAVIGELRFTSLSPGGLHTCGVTTTNQVFCWGFNLNGQLGDGTNSDRATPGQIAGSASLASVTAGGSYTCGLTGTGEGHCWGWNAFGQLGDGGTDDRELPTAIAGGVTFTGISVHGFHSCGRTGAGEAYCWGQNDYGQLGSGGTASSTTPVIVSGGLTFSTVDVGFHHSCGLVTDGSAYCWGRNFFGQLGDSGSVAQDSLPVRVVGGRQFKALSVGANFTCALEQGTDAAFCWGLNSSGQLGESVEGECSDPDAGAIYQCSFVPVAVRGGIRFESISAATQHVCGLSMDQVAYCWGLGSDGRLGDGSEGDGVFSIDPVRVAGQGTTQ
jgi:alpha-tubulin suppressor-like RCC1 family protein